MDLIDSFFTFLKNHKKSHQSFEQKFMNDAQKDKEMAVNHFCYVFRYILSAYEKFLS